MSNDLIPDGMYQVLNIKYSDFAVDLIDANLVGPVSSFTTDTGSPEQKVCTDSWLLWQGLDSGLLVR